jgi:lactoylglutathione lyase
MINSIRKVVLPVDNQEEALKFWTSKVGFTVVRDTPYGEERWIEVEPPEQELAVILSLRSEGQPRIQAPDGLPDSVLMFDCIDIEQTYAEMAARGVEFPTPPMRMPFGWWALFADNEGTRHALGQWEEQDNWRARHTP